MYKPFYPYGCSASGEWKNITSSRAIYFVINMACEHEILCCGARVRICGDRVEVLSEPRILRCPLHEALYGFQSIDKEAVRKTVETKMRAYGFCCEHRVFDDSIVVPYGASEMIKVCMEQGLLRCAAIVCEGAGTVIAWSPSLVQGIGARLTGIIRTSPIEGVIKHIEAHGGMALDSASAKIDQVAGVRRAIELGFKEIAVTVPSFQAEEITELRKVEEKEGASITIFSVCNTCATEEDATHIEAADIVCASASQILRERIGPKALMQIGVTIPIFVLTERGKRMVLGYLSGFGDKVVVFRSRLPYLVEGRGPTLKP